MSSYRVWLGVVCLAGGCWQDEKLIDDTFTEEQWTFLSTELQLPPPDTCPADKVPDRATCDQLATLGQRLFFNPALSGPILINDPFAAGPMDAAGKVSCASCHDSTKPKDKRRRYFIDTRSQPSNLSIGTKITKHNALSVVNQSYKSAVAADNCRQPDADALCDNVFAWTGNYATPGDVITNLAEGEAAMNTTGPILSNGINSDPKAYNAYTVLFGSFPPICENNDPAKCHCDSPPCDLPATVQTNMSLALELYLRRLDSVNSPLDQYIAGDRSAINDQERRGLALFIGKAMCIDCHRGPLLSDLKFHNTGVPQIGPRVVATDLGIADPKVMITDVPEAHVGEFLTPPLRHVKETAPYMHAGQFGTLAEVIEFYRKGGAPDGYSGRRDPRIQPLDLTDDEARDLEAFLGTLTGDEVREDLSKALP